MNTYCHLAGAHDLSLPDWGPYARNNYGLSHLADKKRGARFDYFLAPGVYRREVFPPDTQRESGFFPTETSADLNYYGYRQLIDGNKVFANISYSRLDDDLRLARCEFVNKSARKAVLTLHHFMELALPHKGELRPVLPKGCRWIAAVDCASVDFAKPSHDDSLTWDGVRRGEELNVSGSVDGHSIGKSVAARPRRGFGFDAGDTLLFMSDFAIEDAFIILRFNLPAGRSLRVKTENTSAQEIELHGTGAFETNCIYRGGLSSGALKIISCGGEEIVIDGIAIGKAGDEMEVSFVKASVDDRPVTAPGPIPNSLLMNYGGLESTYGVWWSFDRCFQRTLSTDDIMNTLLHSYAIRNPYFTHSDFGAKEHLAELYMLPVVVAAKSSSVIYSVVGAGRRDDLESKFRSLNVDVKSLESSYARSRKTTVEFKPVAEGRKFLYGQRLMAATILTNVTYPVYTKRSFIRHHTPARYYNSLYTWDSGFIGLGLAELDKTRAIENLNVYVTEPDDKESAFLLHGTPVPVQAYLYAELWNRFQDKDALKFFYPKLKRYYEFLVGREGSSNTARFKSGLLNTWDYFYNSGGWDDYPPQWEVLVKNRRDVSPVVTTVHAIRFAKILSMAAEELGKICDKSVYGQDVERLSDALQKYSWDADCGYFSYVVHDVKDRPVGFFTDANGVNFNMGMDGMSPLIAGVCSQSQRSSLFGKLRSAERFLTRHGLSTVDMTAPYYRRDGYWNGSIWMPHQWFFWKAALDYGEADFARRIAMTALELWQRECARTNYCFEHFDVSSGAGCMCHNFGGLSAPVMNWFNAYFAKGRLTAGFDTWIRNVAHSKNGWRFNLAIGGSHGEMATAIFVSGPGSFKAEYDGVPCVLRPSVSGAWEIELPKSSKGTLTIRKT